MITTLHLININDDDDYHHHYHNRSSAGAVQGNTKQDTSSDSK